LPTLWTLCKTVPVFLHIQRTFVPAATVSTAGFWVRLESLT